ncbi:hypothetical protein THAOC_13459 [Thalassiosira oceanica]|uniref:Polysaccharide biosynthesis protein C-terminal domain-containing protein n=1 Tax=Thalassiosira oceanica TaxID=159749 RepID=K0T5K9_THAOC|nr:hypothetical protein THAOC_13459 [Thalassiosira oceanica]|eukprot:EJK65657.1 hypothetical protein THAOC_13459 [Thalassiosira oceanica]
MQRQRLYNSLQGRVTIEAAEEFRRFFPSSQPDSTIDDRPSTRMIETESNGSEMDQVALSKGSNGVQEVAPISSWPSFDTLDKKISIIALPCIANFAINPLVGAVDLFWINQMKSALAVAGQAAANQVFSSAFWIVSVLPSVTATLVSKANAKGDKEELQDAVCQALIVGFGISLLGSALMLLYPERILSSVLKPGANAMRYARPYLFIRSFAFLPSLVSLIGFSAFRGTMDTSTPLKISLCSNALNAILDPILMFPLKMGVVGAALATLFSEIVSGGAFIFLMMKRKMMSWKKILRVPSWAQLRPLLEGGASLQLRNVALNLTFLMVARVVQSLDETGVSAAAHAMAIQTFQLGGVVLLALSVVAQTMVPNELVEKVDEATGQMQGGKRAAKNVANRLMSWGFVLGIALGGLQLLMLPLLQKSSPLEEVRKAAVIPSILASLYQVINGLVFIGEGVMVGCGNFLQLSLSTAVSTSFCLAALNTLPKSFGLAGVWMSFGVFNVARLIGVWLHQTRLGPLSKRSLAEQKRTQ